jgi:acyl carrier protein
METDRMDLVLEAVAEALDTTPDALTENSSSETVANWDSLRQIIIAKVIEQRFDLTLSDDDLENLSSIGSIRALLARRLGDTRDAQPQAGGDLATGVPSVDMVIAMLNEALDAPAGAIGPDSSAETVANWDSLRQIIIAKVIEQRCAITLSDDDLEALTSVSSIRALLVRHGVAHRSDHGAPAARQDMGIAPAEAAPTSTRRLREDLRTSPSMATIFDVAKQLDDGAITTDGEPSLRVAVLGSLTTDFIAAAIACGVLQERAILCSTTPRSASMFRKYLIRIPCSTSFARISSSSRPTQGRPFPTSRSAHLERRWTKKSTARSPTLLHCGS